MKESYIILHILMILPFYSSANKVQSRTEESLHTHTDRTAVIESSISHNDNIVVYNDFALKKTGKSPFVNLVLFICKGSYNRQITLIQPGLQAYYNGNSPKSGTPVKCEYLPTASLPARDDDSRQRVYEAEKNNLNLKKNENNYRRIT